VVQSAVALVRRVVTWNVSLDVSFPGLGLFLCLISSLRKLSHKSPWWNRGGGWGKEQRYWTGAWYRAVRRKRNPYKTGKEHAEICLLVASLLIRPWKWKYCIPPKRQRTSTKLYGDISWKINILIKCTWLKDVNTLILSWN
jgi:hypothetical protein